MGGRFEADEYTGARLRVVAVTEAHTVGKIQIGANVALVPAGWTDADADDATLHLSPSRIARVIG